MKCPWCGEEFINNECHNAFCPNPTEGVEIPGIPLTTKYQPDPRDEQITTLKALNKELFEVCETALNAIYELINDYGGCPFTCPALDCDCDSCNKNHIEKVLQSAIAHAKEVLG